MRKTDRPEAIRFDISMAEAMLADWEGQPFAEPFGEGACALDAQRRFLDAFSSEVRPFDCLLLAGWRPRENDLSAALAALFDSRWQHGYAGAILSALLRTAESKKSIAPAVRAAISYILSMAVGDGDLHVTREKWGEKSRADIQIWGRHFFICIEHKTGWGRETMIDRQHQTDRLYKDAVARATALGISEDRVIGIYLTPDGNAAENVLFVPISCHEFADAVFAAIIASTHRPPLSRAAASILGFMSYYGRS